MVPQPHLSVDVRSYLYSALNAANPRLPEELSPYNVVLGTPTPMAQSTDSGINTSMVITSLPNSGYLDSITIYYPRMDLGAQYPNGMSAVGDNVESWLALASALNTAYHTQLTFDDFPTTAFQLAVLPATLTVDIAPASLLYRGSVSVTLSGSQPALATVVTTTALSGLNLPTASVSPSDLTLSGSALIYGLVNAANPDIPNGGLSSNNAILGTPTATGATPNTSLQIGGAANKGYTGYVTVTYHRLDIQTEVSDPLIASGLQLGDDAATPYSTVLDLLPAINAALAINLQASDIANGSTVITGTTYPKAVSVIMANTCLTLVGTLAVSVIQPLAMETMVISQALNGFELPQLQ